MLVMLRALWTLPLNPPYTSIAVSNDKLEPDVKVVQTYSIFN